MSDTQRPRPDRPETNRSETNRSETIYQALREAIIERALEPNVKLSEDKIGQQFGVSRTIVRIALGRLTSDGLVTMEPNRGAYVAQPDWEEAGDLFEIRAALERVAISRLAQAKDMEAFGKLRAHVGEEALAAGHGDRRRSIRLATEFHLLLAEFAKSPLLSRYIGQVALRCGLLLSDHDPAHSADCAVNEHRAIIDALERGDTAGATALSDIHLEEVLNRAIEARPQVVRPDLGTILGPYVARTLDQEAAANAK